MPHDIDTTSIDKFMDGELSLYDLGQHFGGSPNMRYYIADLKAEIAALRDDNNFHLTEYSQWLEKYGYLDSDWWAEPPNAVDRFISEQE